jgi:hypothetical protein
MRECEVVASKNVAYEVAGFLIVFDEKYALE